MKNTKTVAFHTLGCKLNYAETSTIAQQFAREGFERTGFQDSADVYVINTCSVTEEANKECRRIVRNALRRSPDAFIIVTGCYAQLKPEEIASIKGVDLVLGANEKFNILSYLVEGKQKQRAEIHSCQIEEVHNFIGSFSLPSGSSAGDRTRAFLKVQDGCDYNCSYCTIPMARGESRSDTVENAVGNARLIGEKGIREIVLTGINLGDFGTVHGNKGNTSSFLELARALDQVETVSRFRISSIEPNLLSNEIIDFVAGSGRFAPHFHVPLQSGSDKILGLMRRRYQRELYADRVSRIKSNIPFACIGADVIVGFPGETEDDFLETYAFLQSLPVSYLHVFTYSEREHTEAVTFKNTIPVEERRKRNRVLRNLSQEKMMDFSKQNEGRTVTVLFESEDNDGCITGYSENYLSVKTRHRQSLINTMKKVTLSKCGPDGTFTFEEKNPSSILQQS